MVPLPAELIRLSESLWPHDAKTNTHSAMIHTHRIPQVILYSAVPRKTHQDPDHKTTETGGFTETHTCKFASFHNLDPQSEAAFK